MWYDALSKWISPVELAHWTLTAIQNWAQDPAVATTAIANVTSNAATTVIANVTSNAAPVPAAISAIAKVAQTQATTDNVTELLSKLADLYTQYKPFADEAIELLKGSLPESALKNATVGGIPAGLALVAYYGYQHYKNKTKETAEDLNKTVEAVLLPIIEEINEEVKNTPNNDLNSGARLVEGQNQVIFEDKNNDNSETSDLYQEKNEAYGVNMPVQSIASAYFSKISSELKTHYLDPQMQANILKTILKNLRLPENGQIPLDEEGLKNYKNQLEILGLSHLIKKSHRPAT